MSVDSKSEYWLFQNSDEIQEALEFYFYMRKKTRNVKK